MPKSNLSKETEETYSSNDSYVESRFKMCNCYQNSYFLNVLLYQIIHVFVHAKIKTSLICRLAELSLFRLSSRIRNVGA